MTVPVQQFVERLAQSGLMTAEEVLAFQKGFLSERQSTDTQALVQTLVEKGRLTEYQATAICNGETRPLRFAEYVVLDRLGQGGMGVVLKARHRRMDRLVAVKMLPVASMGSPEAIQRFYHEVKAAARLIHPNIVTAYDAGEHEGIHYLVMECVEGKDLATIVKERGPLPVSFAVGCVLQAARGLRYAHDEGIIHRDIKPGNLLLDKKGTVKILDMGLARITETAASEPGPERLTSTSQVMGTHDYMAPEQAESTCQADHRADIYSLGCTLFRLLTGKPIYRGDTALRVAIAHREAAIPSLCEVRPDVPSPLDAVFRKMVAKRPEDRHQSMAEVVAELESLESAAVSPAYHVSDDGDVARTGSAGPLSSFACPATATTFTLAPEGGAAGVQPENREALEAGLGKRGTVARDGSVGTLPAILMRSKTIAWLVGAAILGAAAVAILFIVIRVRGREGRETSVNVPDGSQVSVGSDGRIDVTLPGEETPEPQSVASDVGPKYGPDAPPLAAAPFSTDEARKHQDRWAAYLKVPREQTNSIGMKMMLIPPGEFAMGSAQRDIDALVQEAEAKNERWIADRLPDEGPQHRVRITRAFRLGVCEVTVGQFRRFVEETRYETQGEKDGKGAFSTDASSGQWVQKPGITWRNPGFPQTDHHPVVALSWHDAAAFCKWLSIKEATTCRLPTEAEWEYACRAGSATRFVFGDGAKGLSEYGWSAENSDKRAHPVGQKKPNSFGLFDMHGNAWEWCADWYSPKYYRSVSSPDNPPGASPGTFRVLRGGSWGNEASFARSANRDWSEPISRSVGMGFRVLMKL